MTNAELAILSLVAEQPRYGYQIEQVIEERGMREWTEIGFSSIYFLLKKLEKEGLVEGRLEEAHRGPARRVYRPTPEGWEAYRAGVIEALSVPKRQYLPIQLGLANLPGIPAGEAISALNRYREITDDRLEYVQAQRYRQWPLPYFVEAMFNHSLALLRAELWWCERFIKQLQEQGETEEVENA
jgi:DNA-binding PadR family transcriptional regulator